MQGLRAARSRTDFRPVLAAPSRRDRQAGGQLPIRADDATWPTTPIALTGLLPCHGNHARPPGSMRGRNAVQRHAGSERRWNVLAHAAPSPPIIMQAGAAGLDSGPLANIEKASIAKKRGSNRQSADDLRLRELEWPNRALASTTAERPQVPEAALRAVIAGARKLKQGPQVRQGLIVEKVAAFLRHGPRQDVGYELSKSRSVHGRRCRAASAHPADPREVRRMRPVTFTVEVDDELVD